jgi:lipooligosaccharide transport system permease protein
VTPASWRIVEHNVLTFRRTWRGSLFISFGHPMFFLLAFGVGVGGLVSDTAGAAQGIGSLSYLAFVGPGLLASTCMMTATTESTWPVMSGIKWSRHYHAMLAAPLECRDIVDAHALWLAFRGALSATTVALVLAFVDDTRTIGLCGSVLAGVLTTLAFGLPIAAWSMTVDRENQFSTLQRFGITPLYLFAGAMFPVSQLPGVLRALASATPLYHGVELSRGFATGHLARSDLGHALFLVVCAGAGYGVARRTAYARLGA